MWDSCRRARYFPSSRHRQHTYSSPFLRYNRSGFTFAFIDDDSKFNFFDSVLSTLPNSTLDTNDDAVRMLQVQRYLISIYISIFGAPLILLLQSLWELKRPAGEETDSDDQLNSQNCSTLVFYNKCSKCPPSAAETQARRR